MTDPMPTIRGILGMPELDLISRAIERLETLKAESQGEHWYRSIRGISAYGGEFKASPEGIADVRDGERSAWTAQMTSADAELIVRLHRSIDGLLAVLRSGTDVASREGQYTHTLALTLANAILGET